MKPNDPTVRIARAVASIGTASFRRDVQRLEGERNTREAEHLAASLDYVEHEFIAAGFTTTRQAVRSNASNIIAKRGGDGRVVMASAHIDTVRGSPGADDNASG